MISKHEFALLFSFFFSMVDGELLNANLCHMNDCSSSIVNIRLGRPQLDRRYIDSCLKYTHVINC